MASRTAPPTWQKSQQRTVTPSLEHCYTVAITTSKPSPAQITPSLSQRHHHQRRYTVDVISTQLHHHVTPSLSHRYTITSTPATAHNYTILITPSPHNITPSPLHHHCSTITIPPSTQPYKVQREYSLAAPSYLIIVLFH